VFDYIPFPVHTHTAGMTLPKFSWCYLTRLVLLYTLSFVYADWIVFVIYCNFGSVVSWRYLYWYDV